MSNDYTYEYLDHRGISASTFRFYGVQTKCDGEGKPLSDGFVYDNRTKVRLLDNKQFYWAGASNDGSSEGTGLFGKERFAAGSADTLTITEGEYDALSLYEVLRTPCVSVSSASGALRDCTRDREYISSFPRILLAFDSDSAGRKAAQRVAKLFDPNKIFVVKFSNRKDANEYMEAGETDELRNIWHNARRYLPENIVSSWSDFDRILKEPSTEGVPYPFEMLTEMTFGLRTSESVLITAQEGVGKTELMHAIQYKLLENTDANVAAFFIEEPPKRHLQSLAGIKLQDPVHLPGSNYTDDDVSTAIKEILRRDERLFIYSHFGSDDPDVLLDTIRFLVSGRGCRYVLLDHLTMVVTGLAAEKDERRALDYLTSRLEMMVIELDFCLIMVSHVNDDGKTRGSRNAAKVANTIIEISRDVRGGSNTIRLTVPKNRWAGRTGYAGSYAFDSTRRTYTPTNDNMEQTDVGRTDNQAA